MKKLMYHYIYQFDDYDDTLEDLDYDTSYSDDDFALLIN